MEVFDNLFQIRDIWFIPSQAAIQMFCFTLKSNKHNQKLILKLNVVFNIINWYI